MVGLHGSFIPILVHLSGLPVLTVAASSSCQRQSVFSTVPAIPLCSAGGYQRVADDDVAVAVVDWRVSSRDGAYYRYPPAGVPGDLLSDLANAGAIDDPYYDRNFLAQQGVWVGPEDAATTTGRTITQCRPRTRTWIYSADVTLPAAIESQVNDTLLLVVEGIKMAAVISRDGVRIGTVTDQFLRYIFPLPRPGLDRGATTSERNHRLTVTFDGARSGNSITTDGRYMACSGGWDWAPYTRVCETSEEGEGAFRPAFSLGIVEPIYIVPARGGVVLTDVVPRIYPLTARPSSSSSATTTEAPTRDFRVQVEMVLETFPPAKSDAMSLTVRSNFSAEVLHVSVPSGHDKRDQLVTINMTASNVELWWPLGLGNQTMYRLDVTLEDENCRISHNCPTIRKRIGFRTVDLVTTISAFGDDDIAERRLGTRWNVFSSQWSPAVEPRSQRGAHGPVGGETVG